MTRKNTQFPYTEKTKLQPKPCQVQHEWI